ncbi:Farnesyl pyrophosphate synthase [Halotydeus destructor]|nr:Farnesyl pyrophosphate synthase [Halotydeus destructor]
MERSWRTIFRVYKSIGNPVAIKLSQSPFCRTLSTSNNVKYASESVKVVSNAKVHVKSQQDMEQELAAFNSTFHRIRRDLIASEKNEEISEALKWFDKVIMYNVPHGKRNRGLALVSAYSQLAAEKGVECAENVERARVLGWCVEVMQTFLLLADDVMDGSITRRGQLCWYRQDNVGLIAVNDSLYLEAAIYHLLKIHFQDQPYYLQLVEQFLEVTRMTVYGQAMDVLSTPPKQGLNLKRFTPERYANIIKYKTAYYSFSLPVRLAMYLAGITDRKRHSDAESVLLKMGHFFQVQDDYLDCFADPEVLGKIGTDIQDGKCSWPIVVALQLASNEQREILQQNYFRSEPEAVEKVKALYKELDVEKLYRQYEEEQYVEIRKDIEVITNRSKLPAAIFNEFLSKIYRRTK